MELRMYQYRLYPSGKQMARLLNQFKICKEIYNTLLGLNSKLWMTNKFALNLLVKDIKTTCPDYYSQVHSQVLQNISDRLSKAFDNFFRRVKEKKQGKKVKAGFPRFKSRIQSIIYPQSGFKFVNGNKLSVSKVGSIPIILHRIPKGKIKTLTIKQNKAGQWFAILACEIEHPIIEHQHKNKAVGVDVGLTNFATLSDGTSIANPKHLSKAEKNLKKLQRKLSKKKKGSNNRKKWCLRVSRCHLNIANSRNDFLHKLSRKLALQYGSIAVESLQIHNMLKNHCLAKHIQDASWGNFLQMIQYKAVASGGTFVKNPKTRGSSQRCSCCGNEEHMPLSKKQFVCSKCGLILQRDVNASKNHLKDTVGLTGIITPADIKPLHSIPGNASSMKETGTTYGT